jgi:hypothetical protein
MEALFLIEFSLKTTTSVVLLMMMLVLEKSNQTVNAVEKFILLTLLTQFISTGN